MIGRMARRLRGEPLALIRQASAHSDADIERICSSGLLSMILGEHRRMGREDPRWITRSQLLENGVLLRAAAAPKSAPQPGGAFVQWMCSCSREAEISRSFLDFRRTPNPIFATMTCQCKTLIRE